MGAVGQDVEAPAVPGSLAAGKPLVARPGEQAHQQGDHRRCSQAEGGEQHKPVSEGVEHPDALHHLLAGFVESGGNAQPDGVQQHSIEIPARQPCGGVEGQLLFVALIPGADFGFKTIFQFFDELG